MTNDLTHAATEGLVRHLEVLHKSVGEIAGPLSEEEFWAKPLQPGNSVGHLVLHLTGNLKHRVGALLGGTGYVRDRDREFNETNLPAKAEALAGLDEAVGIFRQVVEPLSGERMRSPYPEGLYPTVFDGLIGLVAHFALHRGQISYIARLAKR